MLLKLHILNYAIIDEIIIDFSSRLNVITGETGAGKSILMGALSLILGERADVSSLRNHDKKCIVEGYFSSDHQPAVIGFLKDNDLDVEEELVLRREIAANGKSRGFINDTPVTLLQLKQLASMLVDLHQQFDTLELGEADFQRQVLDGLAGNALLLSNYKEQFKNWVHQKNILEQLISQKETFQKELDFNQYIFNELDQLNLQPGELEEKEAELKRLQNSESIKNALTKVCYELKEEEKPLVQQIKLLINQLQPFSTYLTSLPDIISRMQSTQLELQDIADELESMNDGLHFDEHRIEEMNERLSAGYKLLKKHHVKTTDELLAIQHSLGQKLEAVLNMDDTIAAKEKEVAAFMQECKKLATIISDNRKKQVPSLEKNVNALLTQVGMPNAKIMVEISAADLQMNGADSIEFLFNANVIQVKKSEKTNQNSDKKTRFEPIRKVASGGELSRLMLCIKSLVAQSIDLPTLIFDEIDTGISGEAARQVGYIMKTLAENRQIICITHQPQIAGKADAHFLVFKEIRNDTIKTNIRLLNYDERITTIARMLSGEKPTAAAIENAREIVMN